MVDEGVLHHHEDDNGDSSLQCTDHPFQNSSPGGICPICLQEKLGKLIITPSNFPNAIFPNSSSSSSSLSPSFRSESTFPVKPSSISSSTFKPSNKIVNDCQFHHDRDCPRKNRISFLLTQRKKKKKEKKKKKQQEERVYQNGSALRRSKSTAANRNRKAHFMDGDDRYSDIYSPRKRGFWSFLFLSRYSSNGEKIDNKSFRDLGYGGGSRSTRSTMAVVEERESPEEERESFDRKVSRSRSVGCGSRSFSGDFFERISTGFGDCALRRVESQREGKSRVHRGGGGGGGQDCIRERVKCGGIFRGFMVASSEDKAAARVDHARTKGWGWAFASPIRAFSRREKESSDKNTTPNLAAIPSLLAARN